MKKLLALAAEYDMLPPGSLILCALSGGADSLCMTHFLWEHRAAGGYRIAAAHFNHHLRGEASDSDQAFVRDFCARLGIPLTVGGGDVAARGGNTEEVARQMRYAFLEETAQQLGADRIATAHNGDDNLESLLLNLTRGCGLNGLTGIPPRRGDIVRPLLTTSRAEIMTYLAEHHLNHVEDATNEDTSYARNRLRHQVLPVLRSLNPNVVSGAADTIAFLRQDNDFITAQAAKLCAAAVQKEGDVVLPAPPLARAPAAVAARCVPLLLGKLGGRTVSNAKHIAAVLALSRSGDPSGRISLSGGVTVSKDYDFLRFSQKSPPAALETVPLYEGTNPIPGTNWVVTVTREIPGLVARSRQIGDRVTLPKVGAKTVKDWMIDKKVPSRLRSLLPVVADENGVLALGGFGRNPGHPLSPYITLTHLQTPPHTDEKDD